MHSEIHCRDCLWMLWSHHDQPVVLLITEKS